MFKFAGIIFCGALIFLAGCATAPTKRVPGAPLPANWSGTTGVSPVRSPQPAKTIPPVAKTNLPPANLHSNPPPVVVTSAPVFTWSALSRWAAEQKIGAPHLLTKSPLTTYAIGSSNGVLVLAVGSREATWRGTEIHLGYAPEFIDGEIFVHGLDLEKNLKPLLCAPPLAFGTNRVIVIDPGHGGVNGGTISVLDKRPEKEFTLDWARRLKPLLEANGWTVFLTRANDTYVTNASRVVFAGTHHADLFISLHFNSAAPDTKPSGLETYCFTPTGMPSTVTRGYSDPWLEKISSNDFDAQNLQLAVKLQSALLHALGMEDRGVRHVRYIEVLRNQRRPACLIEGGYLSNPTEAAKIESGEYRQKLAEAVANALK